MPVAEQAQGLFADLVATVQQHLQLGKVLQVRYGWFGTLENAYMKQFSGAVNVE